MPTWPEARAAKETRLRENRSAFGTHEYGDRCVVCGFKMIKVVAEFDQSNSHPMCDPGSQQLLRTELTRKADQ